jgi:hypothetical protein
VDVDWIKATAREATHLCLPGAPQRYLFYTWTHLPPGADPNHWQVCWLDGTLCSCSDFEDPASEDSCWFCTGVANNWDSDGGYYFLGVEWCGTCLPAPLGDDTKEFYMVVRSASGATVTECEPYILQMFMDDLDPAGCP